MDRGSPAPVAKRSYRFAIDFSADWSWIRSGRLKIIDSGSTEGFFIIRSRITISKVVSRACFATALLLTVLSTATYWRAVYLSLGPSAFTYFYRAYCGILPSRGPFDGSKWLYTQPADFAGWYHMGSGAIYIPLWPVVAFFYFMAVFLSIKRYRRRAREFDSKSGFPVLPIDGQSKDGDA